MPKVEKKPVVTKDMTVRDIITLFPVAADVMASYGIHCFSCSLGGVESLEEGCTLHGMTEEQMKEAFSGEDREDVDRMLTALRDNLDAPIEVVGDHATMPYADRFQVVFVRENGFWKIDKPQ